MTTYLLRYEDTGAISEPLETIVVPFCSPRHRDEYADMDGLEGIPLFGRDDDHYEFDETCGWCKELILARLTLAQIEATESPTPGPYPRG